MEDIPSIDDVMESHTEWKNAELGFNSLEETLEGTRGLGSEDAENRD